MHKSKRIFVISALSYEPIKMFFQVRKLIKGFIRLGHDVMEFNYTRALREICPLKSKSLSRFYKSRTDELLVSQIKNYEPHIVYVTFARFLDANSIKHIRQAAPDAILIGSDNDPWPKLKKKKMETAVKLDILTATNDGQWLQDYRDAGAAHCAFLPNACDPDIEHRYDVPEKWKTDILWIGSLRHRADSSETFREELVKKLAEQKNCALYGCCGRPKIGGMDFLYAVSGARIGVSVNAYRSMKFCHSDRLTRFLACGTLVLAKRFEGSDMLYKDKQHLRYFDDINEFSNLAQWYLNHETERKKIADAGMKWVHEQFNCVKIAGYLLDLAEKGSYTAPWMP